MSRYGLMSAQWSQGANCEMGSALVAAMTKSDERNLRLMA